MTKTNDKTSLNVYQRLINLRVDFNKEHIEKTGKNMQLGFKYFTLDDIGEACNRLCLKNGLFVKMDIGDVYKEDNTYNLALANVYNIDNPNEYISFSLPFKMASPIINKQGQNISNDIQLMGSSITYYRRYLWQLVLDLTENDSVDENLGNNETKETKEVKEPSKKPKTPSERKEITKALTSGELPASEIEIEAIYKAGDKLLSYDITHKELLIKLKEKHNNFKDLTKAQAEELIIQLGNLIREHEKGDK